jgi:serine/threonine protein kinase
MKSPPPTDDDDVLASWSSGEREAVREDPWVPGVEVADRYRLERKIGQGGTSQVFAAFDLLRKRMVALKIVSFERGSRERIEARFRREIEIAMQLTGESFVPIYDHGIRLECAYFAMELLIGESLQERLAREGKLDLDQTHVLFRGIASALAKAHGLCLVHRDLKPSNIFFSQRNGIEIVRILDFGIAKDLWMGAKLTQEGMLLGSPQYVSPEQAMSQEVDHRSDLWSLGIILYRCLTGARPFDGKLAVLVLNIVTKPHIRASRHVVSLPAQVDAFFDRALAKRPEDRFQDIESMCFAFEKFAAESAHVGSGVRPLMVPSADVEAHVVERPSEQTQTAALSYEAYAAMISARPPEIPTVEIPTPLLTGHATSRPPASNWPQGVLSQTSYPSPWTGWKHSPVHATSSFRWRVIGICIACLFLALGITLLIVGPRL